MRLIFVVAWKQALPYFLSRAAQKHEKGGKECPSREGGAGIKWEDYLWGRDHLAFFFFFFPFLHHVERNLDNYFLNFILKIFSGFGVLLICRQNHVSLAIAEKVYLSITDNFIR